MRRFAYETAADPPAPVLPLLVGRPAGGDAVLIPALVDTGADCTVIPSAVARALRLPLIDRIAITGIGGGTRRVQVHAAEVDLPGFRGLARLGAFDREAIVGRDLLNGVLVRLHGPRLELSMGAPPRRK